MVISMMFYLGKEKVTPLAKEMQAIVNSYYFWSVSESELERAIIEEFQKRNGHLLKRKTA